MTSRLDAVAAVVASRETAAVLERTLQALAAAQPGIRLVDVLTNGNADLAHQMAGRLASLDARNHVNDSGPGDNQTNGQSKGPSPGRPPGLRVWHHPLRDKANALNQYIHHLWPGGTAYFVDGYVSVRPDALGRLHATLQAHPEAHAAAAVPTAGHSAAALARAMQREGGLHGNLFALREEAVARWKADGIKLPVGMYRVDATMGSILSFNFDPEHHPWDPKRCIAVDARATWDVDLPARWKMSTVRAHVQRRIKQAQGQVENWAVRQWLALEKRPPSGLQGDVHALISAWRDRDPEGYRHRLRRQPLRAYAMTRLFAQTGQHHLADEPYELIYERANTSAKA